VKSLAFILPSDSVPNNRLHVIVADAL